MAEDGGVPLRALLVEDSESDALLLVRELRRGGYELDYTRVDGEAALAQVLEEDHWDVVITDHNLPGFSSQEVLGLVKSRAADVPVIIVSGSIGEDIAVASMKAGAHDYIMKDNLTRLVPAVERELREAERRKVHRRAEETIRHLAFHDFLTGLVNRYEFEQRLRHCLHEAGAQGRVHALLYLDLDQFKLVNDTCGHVAGDELLRQLGMLLNSHVRESDTLARLGGDEFGILLCNCPVERAVEIADKLLREINDFRFVWGGKTFAVGGSIGLVPTTAVTAEPSAMLRAADMACYAAKERGRNRVHVYTRDDADVVRRHGEMEWASRLRGALDENRFVLYKQTIVPVADGDGRHREEMLLRLNTDDGRVVEPGAFIPAAERYNLMPLLDRWVVRHALNYVAANLDVPGAAEMYFINLSGATLSDDSFYDYIREQIIEAAVSPDRLCFEITETAAIANLNRAVSFIREIRELGCHFALDDFGAGMSSFSYLKAIPVDYIKIDGSFIKDIVQDPMDYAIVEAINRIGHTAGLQTIAEFVEEAATLESLRGLRVDYAQGYHISYPLPTVC